jgi:hypothetical protein
MLYIKKDCSSNDGVFIVSAGVLVVGAVGVGV